MRQYSSHLFSGSLIFSVVMVLTACATQDPFQDAERLAARQASHIRQHLPIKSGAYTWIQAQSKGTVINITLINNDASAAQLQTGAFEHNFPQKLCEQPAVITLLEKGVSYHVIVNPEGSNTQFVLNAQTCHAVDS